MRRKDGRIESDRQKQMHRTRARWVSPSKNDQHDSRPPRREGGVWGYLRRRKPYREIARIFQNRYPYFMPKGMDQQPYEEAFIKRAKDYVSNRRRKWTTIIRIGRRREYKRGKRALRERIRQLAWEGAFDVHNEQKKKLPRFTKEQQRFVVANLIAMTPHRKIAKNVQVLFPEFVSEGMDQSTYEEAFIKRAKDYVSNKRRNWYYVIVVHRGRERRELASMGLIRRRGGFIVPLPKAYLTD